MKEVPGGSKPLRRWEYYYWGLGATGIAFLLYNRLKTPEPTAEEKEVRAAAGSWPITFVQTGWPVRTGSSVSSSGMD